MKDVKINVEPGVNIIQDISEEDYKKLDKILLDENGDQRLVKSSALNNIPQNKISLWCRRNGIFQIITVELLNWLRPKIEGKKAIEICAGKGILGRELDIPQTDPFLFENPDAAQQLKNLGESIQSLPGRVEKMDALDACSKYKPEIVIAAWATQLGGPNIPQSSPFGVNENKILKWGIKYIVIGSEDSHNQKKILSKKHDEYHFDWLKTRSLNTKGNLIYVWEG